MLLNIGDEQKFRDMVEIYERASQKYKPAFIVFAYLKPEAQL